jgi:hypothetical protein
MIKKPEPAHETTEQQFFRAFDKFRLGYTFHLADNTIITGSVRRLGKYNIMIDTLPSNGDKSRVLVLYKQNICWVEPLPMKEVTNG